MFIETFLLLDTGYLHKHTTQGVDNWDTNM